MAFSTPAAGACTLAADHGAMRVEGPRERVPTLTVGKEEKVVGLVGHEHGEQRGFTGIRNRSRWESRVAVGVVAIAAVAQHFGNDSTLESLATRRALRFQTAPVRRRWIGLEHARGSEGRVGEAVEEDAGNRR